MDYKTEAASLAAEFMRLFNNRKATTMVYGFVISSPNCPISGAQVILIDDKGYTKITQDEILQNIGAPNCAQTAKNGKFIIKDIPIGVYHISVAFNNQIFPDLDVIDVEKGKAVDAGLLQINLPKTGSFPASKTVSFPASVSPDVDINIQPIVPTTADVKSIAPDTADVQSAAPDPNIQSAAPDTPNIQSAAPDTPNIQSTAPNPNVQSAAPDTSNIQPAASAVATTQKNHSKTGSFSRPTTGSFPTLVSANTNIQQNTSKSPAINVQPAAPAADNLAKNLLSKTSACPAPVFPNLDETVHYCAEDINFDQKPNISSDRVMLENMSSQMDTTTFQEHKLKSGLQQRDYYLLIDISSSMLTEDCPRDLSRWDYMQEMTISFVEKIIRYDPDGITLITFGNNTRMEYKVGEKYGPHNIMQDHINSKQEVVNIFSRIQANRLQSGGTYLTPALRYVFERYQAEKQQGTSKTNGAYIMIVTDGEADDKEDVKQAIINFSKTLDSQIEIGILFLSIGQDTVAEKFLQELDVELKPPQGQAKYDIVAVYNIENIHSITHTLLLAFTPNS